MLARTNFTLLVRTFVRRSHYDAQSNVPKMTLPKLKELYKQQVPLSCVTAHDCISGRMADLAGVDMVLVGDSLAMVAMGLENTNTITLDDMIYHTRAVARGAHRPFLIADLPFGSYETSVTDACSSAIKLIKTGGAEAVKLEGGAELYPIVKHLSSFGICVVPHIGLTPQRQVSSGGFKVQGNTSASAQRIIEDAKLLRDAGASMLLLEGLPDRVGKIITESIDIPTIGIGAGPGTSAQVLVQLDLLGGFDAFKPKFLKRYASYLDTNVKAIREYHEEVRSRAFPAKEHCYTIKDTEYSKLLEALGKGQS